MITDIYFDINASIYIEFIFRLTAARSPSRHSVRL